MTSGVGPSPDGLDRADGCRVFRLIGQMLARGGYGVTVLAMTDAVPGRAWLALNVPTDLRAVLELTPDSFKQLCDRLFTSSVGHLLEVAEGAGRPVVVPVDVISDAEGDHEISV